MSNSILYLNGEFNYSANESGFGPLVLPKTYKPSLNHLNKLKKELDEVQKFWTNNKLIKGALVSIQCKRILPKSNRISAFFSNKNIHPNKYICGICYDKDCEKHIFTYFLTIKLLDETIQNLNTILKCYRDLKIDKKIGESDWNIRLPKDNDLNNEIKKFNIRETFFWKMIKDSCFIEKIFIKNYQDQNETKNTSILKIFKTNIDIKEAINLLNLEDHVVIINETTLKFNRGSRDVNEFIKNMPFLVVQQIDDVLKLNIEHNRNFTMEKNLPPLNIPDPKNEPIVGVIDTLFDKDVYFSKWVDYHDEMIDKNMLATSALDDKKHGTSISSIIVDGPSLNPDLDDKCGRFRVRHFAVALKTFASVTFIAAAIEKIISENHNEIKVWNLSLGSDNEIHKNFISFIGSLLDEIQSKYDVIFVVSGTNNNQTNRRNMKIGEPADSINSLVVNSVKKNGEPASYTRSGPVLSFYCKPDVSYYGGDENEKINVCTSFGFSKTCGTSYAAAWISRKLAFLISKVNLSREVAKALIIDSAAKWEPKFNIKNNNIGYGIVPIDINEIIKSCDDEIKFVLTNKCKKYETSSYNIPLPLDENKKIPYIARATLCYFTDCSWNQGVDYAQYEIDFKFGRIEKSNGKKRIKTINKNTQSESGDWTTEKQARDLWRKWDNVKLIFSKYDTSVDNWIKKIRPKKSTEDGLCGLKMIIKNRLSEKVNNNIKFGVVILLKELNGKNRITKFINRCKLENWIINEVNVKHEIDITNEINEELKFDN